MGDWASPLRFAPGDAGEGEGAVSAIPKPPRKRAAVKGRSGTTCCGQPGDGCARPDQTKVKVLRRLDARRYRRKGLE